MNESSSLSVAAVGASAGGVEALGQLAAGLPPELPYAVLVVLHMPAEAPSVLARIIDRYGPLPAVTAAHGARLEPGIIYVGVPDRHLLVLGRRIVLGEGPTENGHRPAINALFRSVALAFGERAVGVVLSGALDDGVLGSAAIQARGGTTIAQLPSDALFPAMPTNAIHAGVIDYQLAAADMGARLADLAARNGKGPKMQADAQLEVENQIAMARRFSAAFDAEQLGPPAGYTCPDCHGSLIAVSSGNYRCHVGHAWSADALLRARDKEIEDSLWVAVRSLQEKARLSQRMADQINSGALRERYLALGRESEQAMLVLGERLAEVYPGSADPDEDGG